MNSFANFNYYLINLVNPFNTFGYVIAWKNFSKDSNSGITSHGYWKFGNTLLLILKGSMYFNNS